MSSEFALLCFEGAWVKVSIKSFYKDLKEEMQKSVNCGTMSPGNVNLPGDEDTLTLTGRIDDVLQSE